MLAHNTLYNVHHYTTRCAYKCAYGAAQAYHDDAAAAASDDDGEEQEEEAELTTWIVVCAQNPLQFAVCLACVCSQQFACKRRLQDLRRCVLPVPRFCSLPGGCCVY